MIYRRYSSLVVALLLTFIGGFYFWTNGNPSGYLRSQFGEDPERITGVSPEEFSRMLRKRKERHSKNKESHGSPTERYRDADPDTEVRRSWNQRFTDRTLKGLSTFGVTPARPDTPLRGIQGPGPDGETVTLKDLRGRWILLNFWASWCLPCREEMPSLNQLHRQFSEDLVVLGVNVGENRKTVREFIEEYDLDFRVLRDPDGSIPARYDVHALPETWLIDPGGTIVGLIQGPRDWSGDTVHRTFQSVINESNE